LLADSQLKDVLHQPSLRRLDQLLICLSVDAHRPKKIRELAGLAANAGARTLAKSNISDTLGRPAGLAVRTRNGWELTAEGRRHTAELLASLGHAASPTPKLVTNLRGFLGKLTNPGTRAFVEEAILCLEGRHLRAASVALTRSPSATYPLPRP